MTIRGFHGIAKYMSNYLRITSDFIEILQDKEMGLGLYFCVGKDRIRMPDEEVLKIRGSRDSSFDVFCVLSADIEVAPGTAIIDADDTAIKTVLDNIISKAKERIQGTKEERYASAIKFLLAGSPAVNDVVVMYPVTAVHPTTRRKHHATAVFMSNGRHINQATMKIQKI